jgi:hypothetical protein
MSEMTFSKADRQFLASVGIAAEPTFDESRLELARRIAKHRAPIQMPVSPDAARLALVRRALDLWLAADSEL